MRSLLVLVSTVSALDYDSLELEEEGAGRQIFTSGGVAYLALNQTFALLIGRSLYTRDCKGISRQNCYSEFTSTILGPP